MTDATNVDALYQEIILDHYKRPHGAGLRDPFEAEVHHVNPTCGDEVTLRVHLDDGVVKDVSYDSVGCSISQASASVLTDLVQARDGSVYDRALVNLDAGLQFEGESLVRRAVQARVSRLRRSLPRTGIRARWRNPWTGAFLRCRRRACARPQAGWLPRPMRSPL